MGIFTRGEIVLVNFPFSNLKDSKLRPALVVATPKGDDLILAQITSKPIWNNLGVNLDSNSFEKGNYYVKVL